MMLSSRRFILPAVLITCPEAQSLPVIGQNARELISLAANVPYDNWQELTEVRSQKIYRASLSSECDIFVHLKTPPFSSDQNLRLQKIIVTTKNPPTKMIAQIHLSYLDLRIFNNDDLPKFIRPALSQITVIDHNELDAISLLDPASDTQTAHKRLRNSLLSLLSLGIPSDLQKITEGIFTAWRTNVCGPWMGRVTPTQSIDIDFELELDPEILALIPSLAHLHMPSQIDNHMEIISPAGTIDMSLINSLDTMRALAAFTKFNAIYNRQ